ncbi:hypothetical protein [Methylorubrum sp. POS3]|uniref:hypothetical protein n=1 Tax=Methylorubrum sp. POS3 TaxID=2998492 RepID=UPI00372A5887
MSYCAQPFIILAETGAELLRQTRHQAASAMCLADDWAEAGYRNVRIVNGAGAEQDRRQFRETLTLVKQARKRALAI